MILLNHKAKQQGAFMSTIYGTFTADDLHEMKFEIKKDRLKAKRSKYFHPIFGALLKELKDFKSL